MAVGDQAVAWADGTYANGWHAAALAGALDSPRVVVPIVQELVSPASVLDIGCGPATWSGSFYELGVTDVLGIEGPWLDRSLLQIPAEQVMIRDLSAEPLEDLGREFDLALSLEVAEHIPAPQADAHVALLTRHAPVVLFSAAVPYQGGTGHVNERWPSYWQHKFARHGYVAVDCLRRRLWNEERVAWYYRQNLLIYVRETQLHRYPLLDGPDVARGRELPALIHPDRYERLARMSMTRAMETGVRNLRRRSPATADALSRVRSLLRRTRRPD